MPLKIKLSSKVKRLTTVTFILNGVLFMSGGISAIGEAKLWFGGIQIAAGILNFLAVSSLKSSRILTYLIFLLNILVAAATALDYFNADKKYLPYVWLLTALLSLVALVVHYRKGGESGPVSVGNS